MKALDILREFNKGLKSEPALLVSQWADQYRFLSSKSSAEPGLYRTDRTPYLEEIQNKLSVSDPVQKVIVMKGSQVGLTEVGNNWIGYIIDNAPGPALMVQPTDELVKRNSKMRIAPMIESCPRLRIKIKPSRSKDSGNTILQKDFPGGVLVMTGANSAVGLRSMAARYIFLDEVDAYPLDVDGEGSPIALAEKRPATFSNRKVLEISTPTVQGSSVIEFDFLQTDQRYYHVPCPFCGCAQILKFEGIKWETGKYETVVYECSECQQPIHERFKPEMLARGQWIASSPANNDHKKVGYHVSGLYSPFGWKSWAEIAEEWDKAQGDDNKLKTFYNTVLGETWKIKSDAPEWEILFERSEDYKINVPFKEVVFLTAGADVQSDRIEVEIVGWMPGKKSQQIDYRVLLGDTTKPDVWIQLTAVLSETWQKEDGMLMQLRLMAVDSGYNTSFVYAFANKHGFSKVIAVKGSEKLDMIFSPPRAVDTTKHGKKIGKVKVWFVGSSYIKAEIYGFLRSGKDHETGMVPDGFCYFPKREPHYFRSLTAEVLQVMRNKRGFISYVWVKKYERNEALDCRVYARAAAAVVGMDRWSNERWQTESTVGVTAPLITKPIVKPKTIKKDSFWKRR